MGQYRMGWDRIPKSEVQQKNRLKIECGCWVFRWYFVAPRGNIEPGIISEPMIEPCGAPHATLIVLHLLCVVRFIHDWTSSVQ